MLTNHFRQDIPNFSCLTLYHFLGSFDGGRQLTIFQLAENKRLKQLQSHLLRQTTLVQFQSRTNHDH